MRGTAAELLQRNGRRRHSLRGSFNRAESAPPPEMPEPSAPPLLPGGVPEPAQRESPPLPPAPSTIDIDKIEAHGDNIERTDHERMDILRNDVFKHIPARVVAIENQMEYA